MRQRRDETEEKVEKRQKRKRRDKTQEKGDIEEQGGRRDMTQKRQWRKHGKRRE
jgi:hypothetical protein